MYLSSFSSSSIHSFETLVDGSNVSIKASGYTTPVSTVPLPSMVKLSQLPCNHLSISQITRTLNCSVTFFLNSCVFQDLST